MAEGNEGDGAGRTADRLEDAYVRNAPVPGARAGTPTTPIDVPDDSFTDVNPCTGAPTTILVHYDHARLREAVDGGGGVHILFTGEGTYTGNDGFAGKFRNAVTFSIVAGGNTAHAYTNSSQMHDGSGAVALAVLHGHATLVDGVPVVEFDSVSITCVGKP